MSSKIIDAYPRPPTFRTNAPRPDKRRSIDSMQILGQADDVPADDPIFVLRRATTYRPSTARHPAPLDDMALHHLHKNRDSASSTSSANSGGTGGQQLSRAELIAAQREAQRASQRAMLGPQANAARGTDVRLPGGALLRSTRSAPDARVRYAYVPPGPGSGGPIDVSDIVEEEYAPGGTSAGGRDLLAGAGQDSRLERVLARIRAQGQATLDSIASLYSGEDDEDTVEGEEGDRSATPTTVRGHSRTDSQQRVASPLSMSAGSRNATPVAWTQQQKQAPPPHLRSMSSASVMSGESGYRTAVGSPVPSTAHSSSGHSHSQSRANTTTPTQMARFDSNGSSNSNPSFSALGKPRPYVPRDDFGVQRMMAVIELAGLSGKVEERERERERREKGKDGLEVVLFGPDPMELWRLNKELHPALRGIYESGFKGLEEMDKVCIYAFLVALGRIMS